MDDLTPPSGEAPAENAGDIAPAQPPAGDAFVVTPPPRRGGRRTIVALVVTLAVVAGATFAARAMRAGSSGGGSTPEGAVRSFLAAASSNDALGVLGALVPGERDALRKPIQDLVAELVRLQVLDSTANLADIPGIKVAFKDMKFQSTTLGAGHVLVESTGGTATIDVDPKTAPLGGFIRDIAGTSIPVAKSHQSKTLTGKDKIALVTVKQGSRWYTSLLYSMAEDARRQNGGPAPRFGSGLAPIGSASAEEATRSLLRALTSFDFVRALQLLDPDESAAFLDYSDMFVEGMRSASVKAREGVRIDLGTIDLASEARADETVVRIRKLTFVAKSAGGGLQLSWDGSCLTSKGLPVPPHVCTNDLRKSFGLGAQPAGTADLGFVCVQRDGKWYVSPARTLLEGLTAVLRTMKPGDLKQLGQVFRQFAPSGAPFPG